MRGLTIKDIIGEDTYNQLIEDLMIKIEVDRLHKQYTFESLAEKLGICRPTIYKVFRGFDDHPKNL